MLVWGGGAGPRAADVAETWVVLACFATASDLIPRVARDSMAAGVLVDRAGVVMAAVLEGLFSRVDLAGAERVLRLVARTRLGDPSTSPVEVRRIDALLGARPEVT